jgi:hypothetical protein
MTMLAQYYDNYMDVASRLTILFRYAIYQSYGEMNYQPTWSQATFMKSRILG